MPAVFALAAVFVGSTLRVQGDVLVEIEEVRELKPTKRLGTVQYKPRDGEKKFYEKLGEDDRVTGSMLGGYDIRGRKDKTVSWFGIVRKVEKTGKDGAAPRSLTVEHKFFDGLTDAHLMALSFNGGGDFIVKLGTSKEQIADLVLVRVYGKVVDEKDGVPAIEAEYVRVWPWKTFTFLMAYGKDRSNAEWRRKNRIDNLDRIYNPWPDEKYYTDRLGERSE